MLCPHARQPHAVRCDRAKVDKEGTHGRRTFHKRRQYPLPLRHIDTQCSNFLHLPALRCSERKLLHRMIARLTRRRAGGKIRRHIGEKDSCCKCGNQYGGIGAQPLHANTLGCPVQILHFSCTHEQPRIDGGLIHIPRALILPRHTRIARRLDLRCKRVVLRRADRNEAQRKPQCGKCREIRSDACTFHARRPVALRHRLPQGHTQEPHIIGQLFAHLIHLCTQIPEQRLPQFSACEQHGQRALLRLRFKGGECERQRQLLPSRILQRGTDSGGEHHNIQRR